MQMLSDSTNAIFAGLASPYKIFARLSENLRNIGVLVVISLDAIT